MSLVRPARPQVFLKTLNKNISVNFITIADEEWINENFPDNKIWSDLEAGNVATLLSLFWRLMDNESKALIAAAKIMQWDGLEKKEIITDDPVLKLKHLISGASEITEIMKAILKTNDLSMPDPIETQKKSQTVANP